MSTNTVTATRGGASQGMHPMFRELFVAPGGDSGGRPERAGRKARTRTVAVRTVRHGNSRRAATGTWA